MLSGALGSPVHLSVDEKFDSRHLVLRCRLVGASNHAPTSIVLKQMAVDAGPEQQLHPLDCFLNELANLRFFSDLRDRIHFGPRLHCCHGGVGLLIVEDLGDHQTLQGILRGDDARLATDTLIKFGRFLGKVHVATLGRESEFGAHQVGAGALPLPSIASQDIRNAMGDLHTCLGALGVKPPTGFSNAVDTLEAAIHDECSPFRTWTHCDIKTQNVLRLESTQVQLLDFEMASFGHALLDAVSVRMAFPPPPAPVINAGQKVPPWVIRAFEENYRDELTEGIPEAAYDACFQKALVQACAHWALIKLLSMWKIHLKERLADGESYDSRDDIAPHKAAYARFRQQGVAYLQTLVVTAEEFEQLPTIRTVARMVVAALSAMWPEIEPLPPFPAFTNRAGDGSE
jgi:hypothetical protein